MLITSSLFTNTILWLFMAADELEAEAENHISKFEWINDCIDDRVSIDFSVYEK